jgi:hypothetical protein
LPSQTGSAVIQDASNNLLMNSGYGSNAVAYGCRAWVNFNGTGTVAIRASGNVSSITDNNTGNYTINFTTAMPDANYSIAAFNGDNGAADAAGNVIIGQPKDTAGAYIFVRSGTGTTAKTDVTYIAVSIFR